MLLVPVFKFGSFSLNGVIYEYLYSVSAMSESKTLFQICVRIFIIYVNKTPVVGSENKALCVLTLLSVEMEVYYGRMNQDI